MPATKHTMTQELPYWDFVSYVEGEPVDKQRLLAGTYASSTNAGHSPSQDWDLNCGWLGALGLSTYGWPEGRESLDEVRVAQRSMLERGGASYEWDVTGMAPDIAAFLTGDPEHFINWSDDEPRPAVRIGYTGCYHAGTEAEEAVNMGGAVLTLVEALEAAGYAVELTSGFRTIAEPYLTELNVVLKRSDEYVDLDRVAFALVHPAFFRRLYFRYLELLPADYQDALGGGYGRPAKIEEEDFDVLIPPVSQIRSGTPARALETVLAAAGDLIEVDEDA